MKFRDRLAEFLQPFEHPSIDALATILAAKTSFSSSGFPYISESSFHIFLSDVPHLFVDGQRLLEWIARVEAELEGAKHFAGWQRQSVGRALKVLRNVVYSAAVCAPPDLWILKHVLSAHRQIGLVDFYQNEARFDSDLLARQFSLDARHISWDLSLLHCRGYLDFRNRKYSSAANLQAADVLANSRIVPSEFLRDMVEPICHVLGKDSTSDADRELVSRFFTYERITVEARGWYASHSEMETGYRLVPLVLALHVLRVAKQGKEGSNVLDLAPRLTPPMLAVLHHAGAIDTGSLITNLGARVFERGPGPFGIIHAYIQYMRELPNRITGLGANVRVDRLKNIAASQDANRKTFLMANDSLDRFSSDHDFHYGVFIEHALGQGEATRQRKERMHIHLQYFGADLEDAAIDRATELQKQGGLPHDMIFIRRADIGNPRIVIDGVRHAGFATDGAVMFVGNGFHEIRGQTNEKIIEVFREYCDAGILVVFTEESALSDHDLRATGWNTYHAGFRYVHELSGQGLRPVYGTDKYGRHSWKLCASLGGYAVLNKYSAHTRTIYPYPRRGGYNPPISMTYFCVPNATARRMGFFPATWGSIKQTSGRHEESNLLPDHE
jgi:hypothetical protein